MTHYNQKNQIMASLDSLDQGQTEKVLTYIKGMLGTSREGSDYKKFKREALKEIRKALGDSRKLTALS